MGLTVLYGSSHRSFAQVVKEPQKTCRCCSVDRFYAPWMKTLKRPEIRTHLGNASLKITTKNAKAQEYFNQGLNCLHGFWEFEAYRYFLAAIEEDPDCAMAYWGICMSLPGNNSEASEERKLALAKAKELIKTVSKHEQYYINSLESLLYTGSKSAIVHLENIIRLYPEDMNAVGLAAYWMRDGHGKDGKPKPKTVKALQLLEGGLKKYPEHIGLIHYYIHTIESGSDFLKAEPYLKRLSEQGKDISHLLHMPSHIYFLAGNYAKAIPAFEQCYASEKAYFKKENISAIDQPNYSHNLHFWAMTLAEMGRYKEALKVAQILIHSTKESKRDNQTKRQNIYLASTVQCYIHMRFKQYEKAAKSIDLKGVDPDTTLFYYLTCVRQYCQVKAAMNKEGDQFNTIYETVESMKLSFKKFLFAQQTKSLSSREDARAKMIMEIFLSASKVWQLNADPSSTDLSMVDFLFQDEASSPYVEPPLLPCPMAEEVADMCLKKKQPKSAIKYYLLALEKRPKSIHIYKGLALAYQASGDKKSAQRFTDLISKNANPSD